MIKAVIVDLGGVFFTDGTDKFLKKLVVKTGKTYDELYPFFRQGKSIEYRENIISGKDFFSWVEKELAVGISGDDLNRMWVSEYEEIPGMRQIIEGLKLKGIKVSVLSDNVPERVNFLEEKYHFRQLFDDVVLSYEVNLVKTSSEIFNLALKRLKVTPKDVVFVDDREINLEVARKAGIKTILFTSPASLEEELKSLMSTPA